MTSDELYLAIEGIAFLGIFALLLAFWVVTP